MQYTNLYPLPPVCVFVHPTVSMVLCSPLNSSTTVLCVIVISLTVPHFFSPFLPQPYTLNREDVTDIKYVINFDFPANTEDYIHRIGRTARAENTGTSYTFFTTANAKQAKELIEVLKEASQSINPKLYEMQQIARSMMQGKCESVGGWVGTI